MREISSKKITERQYQFAGEKSAMSCLSTEKAAVQLHRRLGSPNDPGGYFWCTVSCGNGNEMPSLLKVSYTVLFIQKYTDQ